MYFQPINGAASALTALVGREVRVEQRVLFKIDLPNRKVISVKSKANKILADVLQPILTRYGFKLEEMKTFVKDKEQMVDISLPVTAIEQERLIILSNFCDGKHTHLKLLIKNLQRFSILCIVHSLNKKPCSGKSQTSSTLDEITNKIFNDVLNGKTELYTKEDNGSSTQSTDLESLATKLNKTQSQSQEKKLTMNKEVKQGQLLHSKKPENADIDMKKPLIAKLIPGVKIYKAQGDSTTKGKL